MIAKCANPACPTRFDHRLGGKFFRFRRPESAARDLGDPMMGRNRSHNVEHFWLCSRCCQVFTLVYAEGRGVVLRLVEKETAAEALQEQPTAA